ncbi:MAG: tetratricopeptide repeat protein [Myxococcota bacterium]
MNFAQQLGLTAEEAGSIAQVGVDLLGAEDFEGALAVFEGLTTLNPDDPSMWAALGFVHRTAGNFAKAEESFQECLRKDPTHSAAQAWLGELQIRKGQPSGRELVRKALADPSFAQSDAGMQAKALLNQ